MRFLTFFGLLALLTSPASAITWYFLRFWAPPSAQFTSLSGTMRIPSLPRAAKYYLWPGLQPRDNTGVYQNVLDGRSGTWWFGSGWCCSNPSLPWGGGFNTVKGETVSFENVKGSNGGWTTTVKKVGGKSAAVTNKFAELASKEFNQVFFAIELHDVAWDFGPLEFNNVVITASGTNSSWCNDSPENHNDTALYSISNVQASVYRNTVTCWIGSILLSGPA